jgi:hypothetical protein
MAARAIGPAASGKATSACPVLMSIKRVKSWGDLSRLLTTDRQPARSERPGADRSWKLFGLAQR